MKLQICLLLLLVPAFLAATAGHSKQDEESVGDSATVLAEKNLRRATEHLRAIKAQEMLTRSEAFRIAHMKTEIENARVKEEEAAMDAPVVGAEDHDDDDNMHPDLEEVLSYDGE